MILIYTHNITPRVAYAMNVVFISVLNCDFKLIDNLDEFKQSNFPKFAYTNTNNGFEVFVKSNELLFESDVKTELPKINGTYLGFPMFFKTDDNSFLPYDIFATVFYFATRYEEYINQDFDKHQRVKSENSLAFRNQLLQKPFLNYLIADFATKLKTHFPQLEFKKRNFNFLSTIDIDNAFAYANKGFKRNFGGAVKDFFLLKFKDISVRIKSNLNQKNDPYNTFDKINHISEDTKTQLQYFVLIGDYSAYDKNPHYANKNFRDLLQKLSINCEVGLHPSYETYNDLSKIAIEKKRLEDIIEKPVTSARCHFLRIQFPETYRAFIECGITDDYTMIYASQCGFRTGLCVPYKWFDLEKNEATQLTIHTSIVMEGVLRDYNKLSVKEAEQQANNLLNEVKQFGGEFVSIYHNDSFVPEQKDWVTLYKNMLQNLNH